MTELYLILHKVRGEPAYDIAMEVGDMWIIPTSGHRAYPLTYTLLSSLMPIDNVDLPSDLPDHYDVKRDETKYIEQARAILGLHAKKVFRRI